MGNAPGSDLFECGPEFGEEAERDGVLGCWAGEVEEGDSGGGG